VKSAAYFRVGLKEPSPKSRFEIGKKQSWDAATGLWEKEPIVLDVARWSFYIASSEEIESTFGARKSIGLDAVEPFGCCEFVQLESRIKEKLRLE
jgi:hypothetical protein